MKYAIISDIHANLSALKAVLADAEAQKCDRFACLGDLVGYYNFPKECVALIRESGMPCVKGNHDEHCSSDADLSRFDPNLISSVKWTHDALDQKDREWLKQLPFVKTVDGFTIVHSTLEKPQSWAYAFSKLDAATSFPHQATTVCFFGHTHIPLAFTREATVSGQPVLKGGTYAKFHVDPDKKYFVNPGSVGQPRDNNPKASYATYDLDKGIIELRRVDYDRSNLAGGAEPTPVAPIPRRPISGGAQNRENLN